MLKTTRRQTISKCSTENKKVYVGFDVSEKTIEIFAVCGTETSKGSCKIDNNHDAIKKFLSIFKDPSRVCVVMETGTHSLWMSELIKGLGFEVIVAHARDLALIYRSDRKNDQLDAEKLARLAQADRKLLHPVKHMTLERQTDLTVLKARDLVVRQRTQLINTIRGLLRAAGHKLIEEEYSTRTIKKCCSALPEYMRPAIMPLLQQICYLDLAIKEYDRLVRKLCKKYPATKILQQITGVGELTSLAFVLIVGDPNRFDNAARLCAYLGVIPKQDQSGDTDKQLGITKKGNKLGRADAGKYFHSGRIPRFPVLVPLQPANPHFLLPPRPISSEERRHDGLMQLRAQAHWQGAWSEPAPIPQQESGHRERNTTRVSLSGWWMLFDGRYESGMMCKHSVRDLRYIPNTRFYLSCCLDGLRESPSQY